MERSGQNQHKEDTHGLVAWAAEMRRARDFDQLERSRIALRDNPDIEPASAKRALKGLIRRAKKLDLLRAIAVAQLDLGALCLRTSDLDEALTWAESALAIYERLSDPIGKAGALRVYAEAYVSTGDFSTAFSLLQLAAALFEENQDKNGLARTYADIVTLELEAGEFDRAALMHAKAIVLFESTGDKKLLGSAIANLGVVRCRQGKHDEAIALLLESLGHLSKYRRSHELIVPLLGLGEANAALQRHEEALTYYRQARKLAEAVGDKGRIVSCLLGEAHCVDKVEGNPPAIEPRLKALEIASNLVSKRPLLLCYQTLAAAHEARGEFSQALHFERMARDAERSLSRLESGNRTRQMLFCQEVESNESMRRSEERFRLAVGAANDGIWDWDLRTDEIYFSPVWFRLLGYANGELPMSKETWFAAIHPADQVNMMVGLQSHLCGETTAFHSIFRMLHKDGEYRWFECRAKCQRDEQGLAFRVVGSVSDITERRSNELILQAQTLMLSGIAEASRALLEYENTDEAICHALMRVAFSAGVHAASIVRVEQRADRKRLAPSMTYSWSTSDAAVPKAYTERLASLALRRARAELVDGKLLAFSTSELAAAMRDAYRAHHTQSILIAPIHLRGQLWGCIMFEGQHAESGWSTDERTAVSVLAGILAAALDRQMVHEAMVEARDAALVAARAKAAFLANMSHEIRTPMNGVIGVADLLGTTKLDSDQRDLVNLLLASGRTLMALIDDILDLSKIEVGKMEIERTPVSVESLATEIAALFRPSAQLKGLSMRLKVSEGGPLVLCDGVRLRQILSNLVSNAVKFTSSGSVTISVDCAERTPGQFDYRICVTDTGIGIPKNRQASIFDMFAQADESTTRRFGGSGLGLAISRQLAHLMDGKIDVKSQEGKGSSFTLSLRLPAAAAHPVASSGTAEENSGSLRDLLVLLVEDNNVNVMVLSRMLKHLGCRFEVARNGLQALELVQQEDFDIVLMDVQMPEMDGLEATKRIRSSVIRSHHTLPVIALTANSMESERDHCLSVGMNDFVTKPVTRAELYAALLRWSPKRVSKAS